MRRSCFCAYFAVLSGALLVFSFIYMGESANVVSAQKNFSVKSENYPDAVQKAIESLPNSFCCKKENPETAVADSPRILWSSTSGSAWLTATYWSGGTVPSAADIAQFGANPTSGSTGVGINANLATNNGPNHQIVGGIEVSAARAVKMIIGNSSTTADGKLSLAGVTIGSNNNVVLRNASDQVLEIRNLQGSNNSSSNKKLNLVLANTTDNVILIDGQGAINIISVIEGAGRKLTLIGNGFNGLNEAILNLSGVNTYSGETIIKKGSLALIGDGSIADSPVIEIAGDCYFDVQSRTGQYILSPGQSLRFSGRTATGYIATTTGRGLTTSTTSSLYFTDFAPGVVPATISGSGGLTLQTTNQVFVKVNNGGIPLPAGAYKLIAKTNSGSVSGTPSSVTVTGDGIPPGTSASLITSNGELYMLVATPSSAPASITGRVVTSDGRGIANLNITVAGGDLASPITVRTNSFGFYRFEGLPVGMTYFLTVDSKKFSFAESTRAVDLSEDIQGVDFIAVP